MVLLSCLPQEQLEEHLGPGWPCTVCGRAQHTHVCQGPKATWRECNVSVELHALLEARASGAHLDANSLGFIIKISKNNRIDVQKLSLWIWGSFFFEFYFIYFFIQQVLISYLFYTYYCIYVNPNFPVHPTTTTLPATFPPWCPYVCALLLCLYFCPAYRFICTIFLGSTYMR